MSITAPEPNRDALTELFEPDAVAFIGASSDPYKLGGRPIRFMKQFGFAGSIYPVHPSADTIQDLPAWRSLDEVPGPVVHAVIVVPAASCEAALESCVRKGVRVVQIFSSGFAEVGEDGARMQRRLREIADAAGIRLLGPNCLGVVSPEHRLFATFSTALEAMRPEPGAIGLATQSGAFGSCAYATAIQRGIGLSRIVATGNEADIDVAECIAWFARDPKTRVICAAIEACLDGERLRSALRDAAQAGKPVIIMKVGATEIGRAAAATHTGSLAGNDAFYDTVFRECGAYRAHSIEQMLDVAAMCLLNPLPLNNRAGIVTLSGGIGILMADAAESAGLELPTMPETAARRLHALAPYASIGNPMDTTAQISQTRNGLVDALRIVLEDTDWGTVFLYLAQKAAEPRAFAATHEVLREIRATHPDRALVLVGPSDPVVAKGLEGDGMSMITDPNRAVVAAGAAAMLRARMHEVGPSESQSARMRRARTGDQPAIRYLAEDEAKRMLADAGLPVLPEYRCASAELAREAARRCGFPVAMKILSPDILHKTEVGGVALGLADDASVARAFDTLMTSARAARPEARIEGVLVCPMAPDGIETIVSLTRDPVFGPMLMFGLGGVAVELFRDIAFASAPVSPEQARALIERTRASALLGPWRGREPMDVDALVRALVAVSCIDTDAAESIASIEINPLRVGIRGAWCLDALVGMQTVPHASG